MPDTHARPATVYSVATNPFGTSLPQAFMSAARIQGEILNAYLNVNIALLDFLKLRFKEDMKLVDNVTSSDDAGEVADAYLEFWREAITEYADEAGKLATMNARLAANTAKRVNRGADEVTESFAAATLALD